MLGFRRLRQLREDNKGVTIIEFAFVAPVMILFITGLLEFGYLLFARSTLESAVLEAARGTRVANCPNENAKEIEKLIQDRMERVVSGDKQKAKIVVQSYGTEFGDVGNPEPYDDEDGNGKRDDGESFTDINGNGEWDEDMGAEGDYGSFGEVVRLRATYNVTSLVPFIANEFNNGKDFYSIEAVTVVRNEPFTEATCALL
ncbi:MAG: TadE family protein [Pseudomonadota bacterium]